MNDLTSVVLVAGVLALLGAVLLWRGWRGKRVGDHPYCRRCGFNLFGSSADAKVCPECGADLSVPRAIIVGVRQRRVGLALGGVGMLLPAVLVLLTIIGASVSGVDWTKKKPPWLLNREAASADMITRDAALAELSSRFTAGTLSNAQVATTVEAGLKYQGRVDLPWSVGWGDFIEAARRKGLVSEDQWARYAKQAVSPGSFKLTLRERVHAGDPVAYVLESSASDRVGRTSRLHKVVRINGLTLDATEMMPQPGNGAMATTLMPASSGTGPGVGLTTVAGSRVVMAGGGGGGFGGTMLTVGGSRSSATARGSLEVDSDKMQQLAAGIHSGEVRVEVKVTPTMPGRGARCLTIPANADPATVQKLFRDRQSLAEKEMFRAADPVLADVELKMPVKLEVLKPDESTVRRIDDEKLRREVEDSLRIDRVRVMPTRAYVQVACINPPTDLAYAVVLRQGQKEWPVGTVAFKHGNGSPRTDTAGTANNVSGFTPPGEEPTGMTVDVVFKPDPAAALANPDIESYWGGEIVMKDVPMDQSTRPAVAQLPTYADPLNALRLGAATIAPPTVIAPPASSSRGVMLKIETPRVKDGKIAADDAPKFTRELLVFPNTPFLQRTTEEDGTITTISGTLRPGGGATSFRFELEYSTKGKDGAASREQFSSPPSMPLNRPLPFGGSTAAPKWITLTLPPPSP